MERLFELDLQLFADEPEEDEDFEEVEDEEVDEYDEEGEEESEEEDEATIPQSELDRAIEQRLARERRKRDKELQDLFGTSDLSKAAEYYRAGMAVANKAKLAPGEVVNRIQGAPRANPGEQPGQPQNQTQGGEDVREELNEIKSMLSEQHKDKMMAQEKTQAKKEFGALFDKYETDIVEKAEESGLSLQEAAAVVLQPHLKDYYRKTAQEKQKVKKSKKVDSTDGAPAKGDEDYKSKLTKEELETARKMRMTPEKYYKRAKQLGRKE